jgi:hypothetical protein
VLHHTYLCRRYQFRSGYSNLLLLYVKWMEQCTLFSKVWCSVFVKKRLNNMARQNTIPFNTMKENNLLFSLKGSETDTARIPFAPLFFSLLDQNVYVLYSILYCFYLFRLVFVFLFFVLFFIQF